MENYEIQTVITEGPPELFCINRNGEFLKNNRGVIRVFRSRSSARKAVSRLRRGVTR